MAPYRWAVIDGALPGGLVLGDSTGAISGVPEAIGEFEFVVRVTDASAVPQSSSTPFSLVVLASNAIGGGDGAVAVPTAIRQSFPNPSRAGATFDYQLREAGHVNIRIYNAAGRLVRGLVDGKQPAGAHVAAWDGRDDAGRRVASGIYFYEMTAGGFREQRRLVLLK